MKWLVLIILSTNVVFAHTQDSIPSSLVVKESVIKIPNIKGEAIIIEINSLTPSNTQKNRVKSRSWINIDTSDWIKSGHTITANILIYALQIKPSIEYKFFYTRLGKVLSLEEYKKIKFTSVTEALKKIKLQKNQTSYSHPGGYGKELWEVARWQHPNLHVVLYDKKRKSYYRYRVGLVVYCNQTHPDATQYDE